MIVQFGVMVILARLLSPSEVGIFSITAVFIAVLHTFRDFGVTSYLQQEKNLTPEKIRSAFGLLLTTSWFVAFFVYMVSGVVAEYFQQDGIGSVMRVMSISFTILPFASLFYALLSRELAAGKQAVVNIISSIAYAVTCISMASSGYSYMSLAWANVANIAVTILVYIPLRPKGLNFFPSIFGWRNATRFGTGTIIGNLLTDLYNAIPDLVLGKLNGPHAVGLYSRANGLVGIFLQVAGPTVHYNALPYISSSYHSGANLGPMLSKATSYLTGSAWPVFIATAVFAEEIILVLYGAKWIDAAPIVAIICVTNFARIGYSLSQASLTAIGRPYLGAISSGFGVLVRIIFVLLIGADNVLNFALALCIADLIVTPVSALLMARYLGYSLLMSINAHVKSLKVTIVCGLIIVLLKYYLPIFLPEIIRLSILASFLSVTWLVSVIYFNHPLGEELPAVVNRFFPKKLASKINALINKQQ